MKISSLIVLFIFQKSLIFGQTADCSLPKDSLELLQSIFGNNKTIPLELEVPILYSLSYFPELKDAHIKFKQQRIKTTMNARPTFGSTLFRKPNKYRFIVRINSYERDSVIQIKAIPFEALIGVFGHEFCHFLDYRTHKKSHLVERAFDYSSKKRKETFEKEIDRMAISRGLGCHLYKWSTYVLFESNAKASYKAFKRSTYLKPHEILELMPQ